MQRFDHEQLDWNDWDMVESESGVYVLYEDHAAALAAKEEEMQAAVADAYRRGQESMRGDATRKAREHCCGTHPAAHAMCGCADVIGGDIERLPLRPEGG